MNARLVATLALAIVGPWGAGTALAQYDYGGGGLDTGSEAGFLLELEGGLTNPRNTDNVVAATSAAGLISPILPKWDDDPAGRVALGYRWNGGAKLMFSFWGFGTESRGAASGLFVFPIGPGVPTGSGFAGDVGTSFDVTTEITARTAELTWSSAHQAGEALTLEWLLGVRYASYEETADGTYADGSFTYLASKSNEGEMIGARAGVRGRYRVGAFSLASGLSFSPLDGEIRARSSLTPQPATLSPSLAAVTDDSRSGTILDFDVTGNWHLAGDHFTLSLGWEQSTWRNVAADLMRDLPGVGLPLRDREEVTFSGLKAGITVLF